MSKKSKRDNPATSRRRSDDERPSTAVHQKDNARELERELEEGLEESMGGSDPPSVTQPAPDKN